MIKLSVISEAELTRLITTLGYAIIAGIVYALIGYFKRQESTETFSGEMFLTSVVVGVVSGIVAYWLDISPAQAVQLILAETALLYYIENVAKAVYRRWVQPWKSKPTTP